jgi:hypothetical protein
MAGHSKFANIKHRKARVDAKKGRAFSKHAKLIMSAARVGGGGELLQHGRQSSTGVLGPRPWLLPYVLM